jgi:hypothetical protein
MVFLIIELYLVFFGGDLSGKIKLYSYTIMNLLFKILIFLFFPSLVYGKDTKLYFYNSKFPYQIIYPSSDNGSKPTLNTDESERAGSEFSINFNMQYKNINLQEIIIHTEKSCQKLDQKIHKNYEGDEYFNEDWYKPSIFRLERKQYFKSGKDVYYCAYFEPAGLYIAVSKRFISKYRIMIVMTSEENCQNMENGFKSLSNQIKFRKR